MKPFTDVLPFGILPTDDRQTVLEKVDAECICSEGVGIRTLNNLGVDLRSLEEDVYRSMEIDN
ncbi:MAG: hypothetical protein DKT66_07515 [Candidatus Melainabacteria bacterium]|nr:MAG: hypothetical protein DKT66_07515 [Candidatus Melainabacteria bacterium]